MTSFRKCHILQFEDSSPKRDSNPHNSIGGNISDIIQITIMIDTSDFDNSSSCNDSATADDGDGSNNDVENSEKIVIKY